MGKKEDRIKEKEEQEKLAKEVANMISDATENNNKESQKKVTVVLGFLLHPNKYWHLVLSFILNNLVAFPLLGIFRHYDIELISSSTLFIFIALAFFTFGEFVVKMIIIKWMPKLMIYSFGLIFFLFYFLIFIIIDQIMGKYFSFTGVYDWLVFVTVFSVTRLIISVYFRRVVNYIFARIEMRMKK